LEARQQELNDRLKSLTSDNKSFALTSSYLLDLAQRAEELFLASDEGLRNKLLEYVLSNIELKDKKLSYELTDPFKTIVETKKKALSGSNSKIWCKIVDSIQTVATAQETDYKLNALAKEFNLSTEHV